MRNGKPHFLWSDRDEKEHDTTHKIFRSVKSCGVYYSAQIREVCFRGPAFVRNQLIL